MVSSGGQDTFIRRALAERQSRIDRDDLIPDPPAQPDRRVSRPNYRRSPSVFRPPVAGSSLRGFGSYITSWAILLFSARVGAGIAKRVVPYTIVALILLYYAVAWVVEAIQSCMASLTG